MMAISDEVVNQKPLPGPGVEPILKLAAQDGDTDCKEEGANR